MAAASFPPSFSSTFTPSPLPTKSHPISFSIDLKNLSLCSSSSTSTTNPKNNVSKVGEFLPETVKERSFLKKKKKPMKNVKKKLDKDKLDKAWVKLDKAWVKLDKAWVNTVTEELSDCIDKCQWLQALQVFDMLREQPFYQPREGTYMKLLVLLGKSGQPERARRLFHEMIEEGLEPTKKLYTALVAAYCRTSAIAEAFSILEQMKTSPLYQPDVYTFSILIKACIDDCQFDLVDSLYEQMDEYLITPNTVTQTIVLSGYGKAGRYEQMEKVLSGMLVSTTCIPNVYTLNTVLSLLGDTGQIEMMEKWYEKFRDFGIVPEPRTFNYFISAYGKKRMYGKMYSVMGYMLKLSLPWTTVTYNTIIDVFAEVGDAENMEYTFDQMRAKGVNMDNKTFCCLIRGYANAGLFHKVINSVQLAEKLEIPENTSFYNAVIYACAKAGRDMDRVFIRMKDKECQPDSMTYELMIEAYRTAGMDDRVYDLEQEKSIATAATAVDV